MPVKPKYYVVWKGRKTGVFSTWEACKGKYGAHAGKPVSSGDWLFAPNPPLSHSIVVDAACSGSPGRLEYRGVDLASGKEIFRQGPFRNGTNNVGEFLAIVHALMVLAGRGSDLPVYSDSETAIGWVKKKRCNTK